MYSDFETITNLFSTFACSLGCQHVVVQTVCALESFIKCTTPLKKSVRFSPMTIAGTNNKNCHDSDIFVLSRKLLTATFAPKSLDDNIQVQTHTHTSLRASNIGYADGRVTSPAKAPSSVMFPWNNNNLLKTKRRKYVTFVIARNTFLIIARTVYRINVFKRSFFNYKLVGEAFYSEKTEQIFIFLGNAFSKANIGLRHMYDNELRIQPFND